MIKTKKESNNKYRQYKHSEFPQAKQYHDQKANYKLGEILQQNKYKDWQYSSYRESLTG